MDRARLLERIARAWRALEAAYSGLPASQLVAPGVTGAWSVKDILAHVTTWEEEALKYLPLILEGGRPPRYADLYGGLDAFNALRSAAKAGLSTDEVLQQLAETHGRLVAFVETIPAGQIATETPLRRRLRLDTYGHYPIHTRAILAWRAAPALDPGAAA